MIALYEISSFRSSVDEMSKRLWEKKRFDVPVTRINQEVAKHPNFFQATLASSVHGIELSTSAKTMFLRPVITKLVLKEKGGAVMNSFCQKLAVALDCHQFSLKTWGYLSINEILLACGTKFFVTSGTGNSKRITLGPLGQLYHNMKQLLKKNEGAMLLSTVSASYRATYNQDLTFIPFGVAGLEDFAGLFYTEFTICGEKDSKAVVLVDVLLNRKLPKVIGSDVVALHCQLVVTGGGSLAAGRCTIVDGTLTTLYDKYIRPDGKVTDYGGISAHHLNTATPVATARREIINLLKNRTVVGSGLVRSLQGFNYSLPRQKKRDFLECIFLTKKEKEIAADSSAVQHCRHYIDLYKRVADQWEKHFP